MSLATTNSRVNNPPPNRPRPRARSRPRSSFSFLIATFFVLLTTSHAAPSDSPFATRARRLYLATQQQYQHEPDQIPAAWQFARACFDAAEFANNSTERAAIAEQGIAACRNALAQNSNSAPSHYYLAMNIGQLAETKTLGALKLVPQIEAQFIRARDLDEHFDYAGPDRNLGMLYRDAPALGSIGSRPKARRHLLRAVELAPDYPDNHLALAEAYLKWNDRAAARREIVALEELWPKARKNLSGEDWDASWADWTTRLHELKRKLDESSRALESPRGKQ